jgi:transposase
MDQPGVRDLPIDDLVTARALIATLQEQLTTIQRENASLRHQLDVLCQRLFGKTSERVDPRQLQLALEQLANEPGPISQPIEMDSGETPVRAHARRRPSGRRPLPGHLPRRRVEIDVAEAEKHCACGHLKTRIGESVSEKLEYEPASFVVIQTARAKYACPQCHEGVVEAPAPPQAVEKSLAGEGLLAHIVVAKYVDHLPLHRLEGIFAREGIELARTTLCGWVADVATALTPIGDQVRREITAPPSANRRHEHHDWVRWQFQGGSGLIWIRSAGRSCLRRRPRMSGTARRPFSRRSAARCKPMRTPATTRCFRPGGSWKLAVGPMRADGLSKPSCSTDRRP